MKKLLIAISVAAAGLGAWAQGTVNFSNSPLGPEALFCDGSGRLLGSSWLAQLYAGPAFSSLDPVGAAVRFLDTPAGAPSGLFTGGETLVPLPAATGGLFQVRVWEAVWGNSFEEALATGTVNLGVSGVFEVRPLGDPLAHPPGLPVNLTGLQGICVIPEPAPAGLWILAAAVWLGLRRERNSTR
ncbi:MAG: hypothetical protein ACYDC1_03910 [Limisphaerales bacterium]